MEWSPHSEVTIDEAASRRRRRPCGAHVGDAGWRLVSPRAVACWNTEHSGPMASPRARRGIALVAALNAGRRERWCGSNVCPVATLGQGHGRRRCRQVVGRARVVTHEPGVGRRKHARCHELVIGTGWCTRHGPTGSFVAFGRSSPHVRAVRLSWGAAHIAHPRRSATRSRASVTAASGDTLMTTRRPPTS